MQKQFLEALAKLAKQMQTNLIFPESEGMEWHGPVWTLETCIMSDNQLVFPLILGLGLLKRTVVQRNVGEQSYVLKIKGCWSVFPFLSQPLESHTPLWLLQQSVFIPVKCSNEARGTYSGFSSADLNNKHFQL